MERRRRTGKRANADEYPRAHTVARPVALTLARFIVVPTLRLTWWLLRPLILAASAVLLATTLIYYSDLPDSKDLFDGRRSGSAVLLDRNGDVFAWRGQQYGGKLRLGDVSPHLIHAIIATEDRRYWRHFGIDPLGIARAIYANLRAGRLVQGGSTLTQQTAKNVFLTSERSLERKVKELPMALALEMKYTKTEILEIYLNRVYLGAGTYGFEAAARRYFGKSARTATPAEAAMLAGLLRAPSRYAPTAGIERSRNRAGVIVRLMEREGYLTGKQARDALANPARLSSAAAARTGGDFADWMMEELPDWLARDTTEDVVIRTTFDPAVQKPVDDAVAAVFAGKVKKDSRAEVAVVVLERDGAVRAMVGGRGERAGRLNRATQTKRQTGSAFKPIVYAAALEAGLSPRDVVEDAPLTIGTWSPRNYTGEYAGPVTLTEALAKSINTVAVRLSERAGRDRVRALAAKMGMTGKIASGPAVALGTSEATLLDMTGVYATIAGQGLRATPYGLIEMRLREGGDEPLLSRAAAPPERAISTKTAGQLALMMISAVEEGTGRRARIPGWQIAGKTGTTQAARDAWFIGYNADYIVGVWMGNDDNTPLTQVVGGGLPAEIWREIVTKLAEGRAPRPIFTVDADEPTPTGDSPGEDRSVIEIIFYDILGNLLSGGESDERRDDP